MRFNSKIFIDQAVRDIKHEVKGGRALVALSGGVDSATCAILAYKALDRNLKIIFLDDGLMRERDIEEIKFMSRKMNISIKILKVAKRFFTALKGKIDPEEKRRAFRNIFYQVLGEEVKRLKCQFLIQGTIAADIVETKGKVKTQHNVLKQIGINPQRFGFKLIEPLSRLYKPEVRIVAEALGLPKSIFDRMPFPGPGLATRIIGEVTPARVKVVREATKIVEEELRKYKSFQCLAVLLNDEATGLVKEKRFLGQIIAVRSVESNNALKAQPTKISWVDLQKIQTRITSEIPSVIKVVYDLTPKPPSTIEYI